VVIENFSAGVARKLKIDYEHLSAINPRIITCAISGFGSNGPNFPATGLRPGGSGPGRWHVDHGDRCRRASDPCGYPHRRSRGRHVRRHGCPAALYERERSGRGQHVDISMLDCQISMLNYMATMYFLSGEVPHPIGNSHFVHVPYNSYPTADGHIIIAVIFDSFWENLLEVVDEPAFRDEKYLTQPGRLADKALSTAASRKFSARPSDYWLQRWRRSAFPAPASIASTRRWPMSRCWRATWSWSCAPRGRQSTRGPGNPIKLSRTDEESFARRRCSVAAHERVLGDLLGYSARAASRRCVTRGPWHEPIRDHHQRGRSAGRAAEPGRSPDAWRSAGALSRRCSAPACAHRDRQLRVAEGRAADGRHRRAGRGLAGRRARALGAGAEHERLRTGPGGRCRNGGGGGSATETMNQKNIRMSLDDTLAVARAVIERGAAERARVQAYLAVAFECPFEGAVDAGRVCELRRGVARRRRRGTGDRRYDRRGEPGRRARLMDRLVASTAASARLPLPRYAGAGLANVYAAIESGVRRFDASVGGLGGCPFAPGRGATSPRRTSPCSASRSASRPGSTCPRCSTW
jgi:CoA:oxalate CoA-transferase